MHSSSFDQPRFPNIDLSLIGKNGNVFNIIGNAKSAMKAANLPDKEIDAFLTEALSDDYDQVIRTCLKWFSCN